MRLKTIEKKIKELGFEKKQDTPDVLLYEKTNVLDNCKHFVSIDHTDNCMYYLKSYKIHIDVYGKAFFEAFPLTYEASNLFTQRMKKMIMNNLKQGRF